MPPPSPTPLRLALIGYGRMGRLIDQMAPDHGAAATLRLTSADNRAAAALTPESLRGIDVAIDFSVPDAVPANLERLCDLGIDTVVGATGWDAHRPRLLARAERSGIGLVHGANFSIGVNAFYRIVAAAAGTLQGRGGYHLGAFESHHRAKLDAPSGTALRLLDEARAAGWSGEIDVASQRVGHVPGTHELVWDSEADAIVLRHAARSRKGFAAGALAAAKWIHRRPGVYDFAEWWERIADEQDPTTTTEE